MGSRLCFDQPQFSRVQLPHTHTHTKNKKDKSKLLNGGAPKVFMVVEFHVPTPNTHLFECMIAYDVNSRPNRRQTKPWKTQAFNSNMSPNKGAPKRKNRKEHPSRPFWGPTSNSRAAHFAVEGTWIFDSPSSSATFPILSRDPSF